MTKGNWCQVSNCKNRVTSNGTECGTHRYRMKEYGQYDLPDYSGVPNYKPSIELPVGIFKLCQKHGELKEDQVYPQWYKGKINSYNCKLCTLSNNISKKYKGMNGLEDLEEMLANQGGVCKLCKGKNNTTRNGKIKRYNIDHCHSCEEPRGALCSFCNSLLGYAKDSIQTLEEAINYLKSHNKEFHNESINETKPPQNDPSTSQNVLECVNTSAAT